jgi:hypothetical protein
VTVTERRLSEERLFAALRAAGMSEVPARFSIATVGQEIPETVLAGIEGFIRLFDQVTSRPAWREVATASGPEIARAPRSEVCFFSAWDFHLRSGRPENWQLIEVNDNGSGVLFAALVNRLFWEHGDLGRRDRLAPPPAYPALAERVADMIEHEARAFFGRMTDGLVLIVDDAESLQAGRFRDELVLLRELVRRHGRNAEIAAPSELRWENGRLLVDAREVSFVINRSTDFFFEAETLAALRAAYRAGHVYVAPNPFSYATRSDKALLAFLSHADSDGRLGIRPDERAVLAAHVPATWIVRAENIEQIAAGRDDLVVKPAHGYAGHGLLDRSQVGRSRLRRLLRKGVSYVAQQRVPKARLVTEEGVELWTDLRVWAYRGQCFLASGRASRHPDRIDLSPPGGWLPTYVRLAPETPSMRPRSAP